jgi:hypothetical protein
VRSANAPTGLLEAIHGLAGASDRDRQCPRDVEDPAVGCRVDDQQHVQAGQGRAAGLLQARVDRGPEHGLEPDQIVEDLS